MMRYWLTLLLLTACALSYAQEHIVARVVDSNTGKPLPFASVYVSGSNSTITNVEGDFFIDVAPTDTIRFTYVGYKTVFQEAKDLGTKVQMQPDDLSLDEVTVLGTDLIMQKVLEKLNKEYKKQKRVQSNFFYRQLTYCNDRCNAFLESFFSGKSAIQLRDLSLVTGRYASLASSLTANPLNFFTFAQQSVFSPKRSFPEKEQLVPIYSRYAKSFKITSQAISDGERTVYRLDFKPLNKNRWTVRGSFYVDASTFELLKYEGEGLNETVLHKVRGMGLLLPLEYSFTINYEHEKDFTEVSSVYFKTHLEYLDFTYETTGIAFNVGDRYFKGRSKMAFNDNLLKSIKKQGLDREFWQKNEIVKRTPLEEEALELFEHDNLFGLF